MLNIQELFDAAVVAGADRNAQAFRYRFSSAGDPCLRALVYDAWDADDGKPPANSMGLKGLLASACGTAVHVALQEGARRLGDGVELPAELETGEVLVRGSSDWRVTRQGITADFKVVGEGTWSRVQSRPKDGHTLQVNGYAFANDDARWAVVYIRGISIFQRGEVEVLVHYGLTNREKAQELMAVWEDVHTHRKLRTLPERPFGALPGSYPCAWCRHKERCHSTGRNNT